MSKNSITDLIKNYLEAIKETEKHGRKIGQMLVKALKPIIPDIDYSLGWAEAGVDTICLWSKKHEAIRVADEKAIHLTEIIEEVFGEELRWHIDCPFGIWLLPEEARKVKEVLKRLKEN